MESEDGRNVVWRVRMGGMECGEWGWKGKGKGIFTQYFNIVTS